MLSSMLSMLSMLSAQHNVINVIISHYYACHTLVTAHMYTTVTDNSIDTYNVIVKIKGIKIN